MNSLIVEKIPELERICRRRGVRRIELFGSAAGAGFDRNTSDLDFLVTFEELGLGHYADAYFGLKEDLEGLFQRPVDLVVDSAIRNPYFRQAVDATRTLIYLADAPDMLRARTVEQQVLDSIDGPSPRTG